MIVPLLVLLVVFFVLVFVYSVSDSTFVVVLWFIWFVQLMFVPVLMCHVNRPFAPLISILFH